MKNLILPKKLNKGDTIAFISPSAGLAPFAMHRIEKAIETFNQLGYKVKIAKHALENAGYVSTSIEKRIEDIHSVFSDRDVKMVIATIGGNHSNQLLKYIDYRLIRKNPKIFVGYSDITVLHFAFMSQANLATYYGPCVMTQFGEFPKIFGYTLRYFNYAVKQKSSYRIDPSEKWTDEVLDWFKKKDLKRARKMKKNKGYEWLKEGKARGPILGGTIPSINHLAGTKFWCNPKGTIYFIDIPEGHSLDKGLSIADVDSLFADLDNLGIFRSINGLIIGRPYHYNQNEEDALKEIILKYTKNKKYPILYNANIGHIDPIVTIRLGATVLLDSKKNKFSIFLR